MDFTEHGHLANDAATGSGLRIDASDTRIIGIHIDIDADATVSVSDQLRLPSPPPKRDES